MKFPGLLKCWPPTPPRNPPESPGVGWVKHIFIAFLDSSWHFPDFWFFDPLKFQLRPPPWVGGQFFLGMNHSQIYPHMRAKFGHDQTYFFAFKVTMSRHFAGYSSVALETIWLHEPRDLIFLGPLMTLRCIGLYRENAIAIQKESGDSNGGNV